MQMRLLTTMLAPEAAAVTATAELINALATSPAAKIEYIAQLEH